MKYLSLFSGIEAATVAWHPLGWECAGVSEIEPFPCAVLAHHYPNVPNLGDVTRITEAQVKALGHIDIVVFGSPCQDLSVAGHRKGLINADGTVTRSGLFFTAVNIARWSGARFWLWENVPGAFSSNKGRDFASVVEFMAGLDDVPVPEKGWGTEGAAVGDNGLLEWGVLDAQWFGVAQRRRRVFALLDTGDWADRPPILLEPEGMRGDSAPRRETGEDVTGILASRTRGGGFPGSDEACSGYVQPVAPTLDQRAGRSGANSFATSGGLIPVGLQRPVLTSSTGEVSHCLNAGGMGRIDYETETMIVTSEVSPTLRAGGNRTGGDRPPGTDVDTCDTLVSIIPFDTTQITSAANYSNPLAAVAHTPTIAFNSNAQPDEMKFDEHVSAPLTCSQYSAVAVSLRGREGGGTAELGTEVQNCLRASGGGGDKPHVLTGMRVRRLLPTECEALQGFPRGYTAVPDARGKPSADGPRYKALGNSMAVPVMRWIGQQIEGALL